MKLMSTTSLTLPVQRILLSTYNLYNLQPTQVYLQLLSTLPVQLNFTLKSGGCVFM